MKFRAPGKAFEVKSIFEVAEYYPEKVSRPDFLFCEGAECSSGVEINKVCSGPEVNDSFLSVNKFFYPGVLFNDKIGVLYES